MAIVFKPSPKVSKRVDNPIVCVRLPNELIKQFYELCQETGLSPGRLGSQCIQFALDHYPAKSD